MPQVYPPAPPGPSRAQPAGRGSPLRCAGLPCGARVCPAVRGSPTPHPSRPVGLQEFGRPAVGRFGEVRRPSPSARSGDLRRALDLRRARAPPRAQRDQLSSYAAGWQQSGCRHVGTQWPPRLRRTLRLGRPELRFGRRPAQRSAPGHAQSALLATPRELCQRSSRRDRGMLRDETSLRLPRLCGLVLLEGRGNPERSGGIPLLHGTVHPAAEQVASAAAARRHPVLPHVRGRGLDRVHPHRDRRVGDRGRSRRRLPVRRPDHADRPKWRAWWGNRLGTNVRPAQLLCGGASMKSPFGPISGTRVDTA